MSMNPWTEDRWSLLMLHLLLRRADAELRWAASIQHRARGRPAAPERERGRLGAAGKSKQRSPR
jgi:hypothetical protein